MIRLIVDDAWRLNCLLTYGLDTRVTLESVFCASTLVHLQGMKNPSWFVFSFSWSMPYKTDFVQDLFSYGPFGFDNWNIFQQRLLTKFHVNRSFRINLNQTSVPREHIIKFLSWYLILLHDLFPPVFCFYFRDTGIWTLPRYIPERSKLNMYKGVIQSLDVTAAPFLSDSSL